MDFSADIARYAAAHRARAEAHAAHWAQRRADVLAALPAAAALLRDAFGATEVGVFGSVLTDRFGEGSDIDLYVDRIDPGRYFQAVDRVICLLGYPIDLVELTRASDSLRAHIAETGRAIE